MSVNGGKVFFGAHRHTAGAVLLGVHLLGSEEMLLSVLVRADREHVETFGTRDLDYAFQSLGNRRPPEMMAQQRIRRFPANTLRQRLRRRRAGLGVRLLAPQESHDCLLGGAAGEGGLE